MTLASGTGERNALVEAFEQENAQWRDLVQRHADALREAAVHFEAERHRAAAANALLADAQTRLSQVADLCDEADAEVEPLGWSLGGLVSTGELRAAIGVLGEPS